MNKNGKLLEASPYIANYIGPQFYRFCQIAQLSWWISSWILLWISRISRLLWGISLCWISWLCWICCWNLASRLRLWICCRWVSRSKLLCRISCVWIVSCWHRHGGWIIIRGGSRSWITCNKEFVLKPLP